MKIFKFYHNDGVQLKAKSGYYVDVNDHEYCVVKENRKANIYDIGGGNYINSFSTIKEAIAFLYTLDPIIQGNLRYSIIEKLNMMNDKLYDRRITEGFVNDRYNQQRAENVECRIACNNIKYAVSNGKVKFEWKKFRNCSAEIAECKFNDFWGDHDYIVLKSYNTIVAVYDKDNDTVYDFLRYVYGYTSTSNQHICKFISEMIPLYTMRYEYI